MTMFNGYNESALISYEFNSEREKKSENVSKYSYAHDGGVQPTSTNPNNRQSEFWSGKPNFVGIPSVVNCNCTGCYPTTENQSYQVQPTRHRPWLPKTFSVPLNGSNECKLPAYQWDNALNQICYSDPNIPYGQENGGKQSYYRQFQTANQPGVIISANKQKNGMEFQNGIRQPVMCNPNYDLTKRVNGRSYYEGDEYSFGAHSLNQVPRLPVEPYIKAVPSNLNQNRVPSMGHRKENSPQCDHYNSTKIFPENYRPGLSPMDLKNNGIHVDYSCFNRDADFCRNNYTEIKQNNMAMQSRKDCSVTQNNPEQQYGRPKHPETLKGCEMFYTNLEKNQMGSYIQRIESDGMNRMSRSTTVCNDLRYADGRPQVFPYQNNAAYRNYVRPEYSQFSSQCVPGFQETNQNQYRTLPQRLQSCDQYPQGNNGSIVEPQKGNSDGTQSYGRSQLMDGQSKPNYLESIRSEELIKNGTNKISPLRLLRKKKLVTAPQELSSTANSLETPTLDVRKFWSTWAEEEDENVSPTQMVVLDCQNIDPEQAKLLNFYDSDPSRPLNFENVLLKNSEWIKDNIENVKESEQPVSDQDKQVEIFTQIEPVSNNANGGIPEVEAVNVSPKKYRSLEHRKKKKEEIMDKWTEKKFDFLKKSEESKVAEMIRYEEEKKKLLERRLSFHQVGSSKSEKLQEDVLRFEKNSQSNSPTERTASDLPTSEYRRNKFLDYSEVTVNCFKDTQKIENMETNQSTEAIMKKEEPDVKLEADSPLEMHDILKKITEIDLQEMKLENGFQTSKKTKKLKKKKLDQMETDGRTDLKLETASKPTIKFSIQKSHDLKISFKVLNKKYEEEVQSEETKPIEDTNTELITLKYKSIQNGAKVSDSKKKKGKLRRKKHDPVLKIKKSKYTEEERNPLAEDDEGKTFQADGFQVQETVDSAKIKLTFKRHKTNLETEYKIDREDLNVGCEESENNFDLTGRKCKKKLKRRKKHKNFAKSDIDSSWLEPESVEQHSGAASECVRENCLQSAKNYSGKSPPFQFPCSIDDEEAHKNSVPPFGMSFPEEQLCEFTVQNSELEDSNCKIDDKEQLEKTLNSDETSGLNNTYKFLPNENAEEAISKCFENKKSKTEIQEISLDFTRTINSLNIETNREIEKTEKIEDRDVTEDWNKNDGGVIESTNNNHSKIIESSYELKKKTDCLEINADQKPILPKKRNANFKSDADKNASRDFTEKDTFGENISKMWVIESGNTCNPESESEHHSNSKIREENLNNSLTEKTVTERFESHLEETVEVENEKLSKIELENIIIKIVDNEVSENRVECHKENVIRSCEQIEVGLHKISDNEHSESSEMKLESLLPLSKTMHQLELETVCRTTLSDCSQIDKWIEPNQMTIKEGEINVESIEPFDGQSNRDSPTEIKFDSENQSMSLPRFENKESKTVTEDQVTVDDFIDDDEQKRFLSEVDINNCMGCDIEDKLYESDAVTVQHNKFLCGGLNSPVDSQSIKFDDDDNSYGKSNVSDTEGIRVGDFTEQMKPENINFDDNLTSKKCVENKPEPDAVNFDNANQRTKDSGFENISRGLDIDHFIQTSEFSNNKRDITSEQEVEMICDSQNPLFNEPQTQVQSLSQAFQFEENREIIKSDKKEINDPEIEFNLSISDYQNAQGSSQVEPKDCSPLEKKAQPEKLSETSHFTSASPSTMLRDEVAPETLNHESDECITQQFTSNVYKKNENHFNVVSDFLDDTENHKLVARSEKFDEVDKQSETTFLNDKLTFLTKPQEDVTENKNKSESSGKTSPTDDLRVNSLTDRREIKLNEKSNFVENPSLQSNDRKLESLKSPSNQESELEEGEIVDSSSDDSDIIEPIVPIDHLHKSIEFKTEKPVRRHSISFNDTEYVTLNSLCPRKFTKSKSCPPRLEIRSFEFQLNIPIKDIPLPMGPPPFGSCFSHHKTVQETNASEETKENLNQVPIDRVLKLKDSTTKEESPRGSPFGAFELENCRNPSPPRSDALGTHRNKIKFTLMKRSRFSKVGLYSERPTVFEKLKFFEKSQPKVLELKDDLKQNRTEDAKKSKLEIIETLEKPEMRFTETLEEPDLAVAKFPEKSDPDIIELKETQETIYELAEAEAETVGLFKKPEMEVKEPFETSELKPVILSEVVEPETIDSVENLELEVVELSINIDSENVGNKIRTPDYISETVEQSSQCQITEVPTTSPVLTDDKNQKNDLEIESLCDDANVEVVDVMNDFIHDEFFEDIPTSEDLPNGDFVDEKVNDDKFRNIMQNCLENAKKFLNVGNLKLFSCSVDDLLELDNQENEPVTNHISRDVLLTSCEDTNDDLGLNEKFQPVDISMEFIPSDVCPEILPVDNWPYLEEEVPSSPLKLNETDLILENTISEDVPNRKRASKETENYKRFRRKSLVTDEETLCSKLASHRRKTIDGFNSFLPYTKLNGIDKPNESLKCRLSLEKLTNNGVEFICPQSDLTKKAKDMHQSKKLNYKSPLWQPKVMLIRISENEVKRFKKPKIHDQSNENVSIPAVKELKSDHSSSKCEEDKLASSIPQVDSTKEAIVTSPDRKKHKPRFRNLHTKRKPEQGQSQPKEVETALSELFKDFDEEPKNVKYENTNKNVLISGSKVKSESKSDRHLTKSHFHKDKSDHRDRKRENNRERNRHKEKRKHERNKHDDGKRHRNNHPDDDRKRSVLKSSDSQKGVNLKEGWVCEVCGFNDANERVAHIKSHPFHCQSCHLAFQTETHFISHLTELHKDIRNQHHCLLCELSFQTEEEYQRHLETREHTHLEAVEKNTINTLFTLLTGAPCPVLGLVEMKPEWLPSQPGTVHFYHQATPLSLALQYLKMHRDLTSRAGVSKVHPN